MKVHRAGLPAIWLSVELQYDYPTYQTAAALTVHPAGLPSMKLQLTTRVHLK